MSKKKFSHQNEQNTANHHLCQIKVFLNKLSHIPVFIKMSKIQLNEAC